MSFFLGSDVALMTVYLHHQIDKRDGRKRFVAPLAWTRAHKWGPYDVPGFGEVEWRPSTTATRDGRARCLVKNASGAGGQDVMGEVEHALLEGDN